MHTVKRHTDKVFKCFKLARLTCISGCGAVLVPACLYGRGEESRIRNKIQLDHQQTWGPKHVHSMAHRNLIRTCTRLEGHTFEYCNN